MGFCIISDEFAFIELEENSASTDRLLEDRLRSSRIPRWITTIRMAYNPTEIPAGRSS
jgi:hypothetical protein